MNSAFLCCLPISPWPSLPGNDIPIQFFLELLLCIFKNQLLLRYYYSFHSTKWRLRGTRLSNVTETITSHFPEKQTANEHTS